MPNEQNELTRRIVTGSQIESRLTSVGVGDCVGRGGRIEKKRKKS